MGMTSGWVATALWWAGVAVCAVGGLVVIAALFRDRSRGRRRCPRCWYDMQGVPGLTCPECGRTAKREKKLYGTRRRWGRAVLGVMAAFLGVATAVAPSAIRDGPLSLVPTAVLVRSAPSAWDDQVWDAPTQQWVLHPVAAEIERRLKNGQKFRKWEWRNLLERAQVVRTRRTWLEDTELGVELRLPAWFRAARLVVRTADGTWLVGSALSGADWAGEQVSWGDRVAAGAQRAEFEVEIESGTGMGALSTLFEVPISVPVRAVTNLDEVIAPDRSPEFDSLVRHALEARIRPSADGRSNWSGYGLHLTLDGSAIGTRKEVGVSLIVELLSGDRIVETRVWHVVPAPSGYAEPDLGDLASMPLRMLPVGQATDPVAQNLWTVRIRGVRDGLMDHFEVERYWAGEIVLPIRDLMKDAVPAQYEEGADGSPRSDQ